MPEDKITPEQNVINGMKAYQAGDYSTAITLFANAQSTYTENRDHLLAGEVANDLSVCYLKSGEPQKAFDVIMVTADFFGKSGDIRRQAITLGNQAAALEKLGKMNQAVEKYEECSRLFKQIGDNEDRVVVLQSLSELQMKMGQPLDAMSTTQIALMNKKKPSLVDRLLKKLLQIPFRS